MTATKLSTPAPEDSVQLTFVERRTSLVTEPLLQLDLEARTIFLQASDSQTCHTCLLVPSKSSLYVLRVLRVHGIPDESLQEVFRVTLLAKITYAI